MIGCGASMSTDLAIYLCVIFSCEAKDFEWSYLIEHCLISHTYLRTIRVQYIKILLY